MQIRCPHCHQPVELVENTGMEHIDCPSCGSHFSFLGEATVGYDTGEGRTIGHFELVEKLGMGQFGTVWMARDIELQRTVAVKMPRQEQLSPGDLEIFLREARAAAQLHHPNIVGVHEVGREGDTVYIVSDLVQGVTLADRLTTERLSQREAASLCATIAEALHHAHQSGVIHRDLKPSNIMIDAKGQPHLMDFGLAKREAGEITMTMDGRILGTPAYMSPEQARGEAHHADARSDIYSLGTILFELLTGELPFRGNKRMLLMQIIHDEPPSPRKLDSAVPRDLETICLKCLEKPPERRYAAADEVADELRRYLAGKPLRARPVSRMERSWRWCRRNPLVAGLTAAVVLSLVAGSLFSAYFAVKANDRATSESMAKQDALMQTQIAQQNADRAEKNAAEARRSAEAAKASAEKETAARRATERELRIATAHRLAALSHLKRSEAPDLSLALSIESGLATRTDDEGPLASSHQAALDSLTMIGGRPLVGHRDRITGVAVTSDGRFIFTASWDNSARMWKLAPDGPVPCVRSLEGPEGTYSLAVSPDGRWLATGNYKAACLWDLTAVDEDANASILGGHSGQVGALAISADSHWLVTAGQDYSPRLWDLTARNPAATGRALPGHQRMVSKVAISHDNHWLVTGSSDGTARVWDLTASDPGAGPRVLMGHQSLVRSADISADGRLVVTGSHDNMVRVWDLTVSDPSAKPIVLSGHRGSISSVALSPNNRWVVAGSGDNTARIWDLKADDPSANSRVLSGHQAEINCLAVSQDGRWVVTGSVDETARVWNLCTDNMNEKPRILRGHHEEITSVAISPDSRWVVTGSSGKTARLWDLASDSAGANPSVLIEKGPRPQAISPDTGVIVQGIGYGQARIWHRTQEVLVADPRLLGPHQNGINCAAISADGRWIVTGGNDGAAAVWDFGAGDHVPHGRFLFGHRGVIKGVAISADGRWLATGSTDGTTRLWDLTKNGPYADHHVLRGYGRPVLSVSISADGRRVATAESTTVRIWDHAAGDPSRPSRVLDTHLVKCVAISADGRTVVAGGGDGTARVWRVTPDNKDGKPRLLRGHQRAINSVSISPDGRWAVTGSSDKTARIWDLTSDNPSAGQRILAGAQGEITNVMISPDGRRVVALSSDFGAWTWHVQTWQWQWDDLVSLAGQVGRNLDQDEWKQFFPGEPYRKTFQNLPGAEDR